MKQHTVEILSTHFNCETFKKNVLCVCFHIHLLSCVSACVWFCQSEEVVNVFPAPHTHTHADTQTHTHTHWGRGGESRAQAKEGLRQQRASEENGDHAGRVPPLVDAAQRADFLLALPPAVLSTLLHFTLRWGELGSACCFHRVGRRAVSGAGSPSPGGEGGGGGGGGALLAGGDKLSRRCCLVSRDWAMLVSG